MDRYDLIAHQLKDPIYDGLEALQDLLVSERHVTLLDACVREVGFDSDIHCPFLAIVAEVGLDPILKVHDTLGINLACRAGTIRQFHLTNLRTENVAKVPVERGGTTRISRARGAFRDAERLLFFDLIRNQVDRTTSTIDNQDGVTDLEVQQTGLCTEKCRCLGFGNQGQAVVILVSQEAGLEGGGSCCCFPSIVPNGRYGDVVPNVSLFTSEHFTQGLLELGPHGLSQLEEVVGGDIDLRLARRQRRQVDGVNVRVPGEHQLKLEPLDFLYPLLRVSGGGQSISDIRAPTHHLLVLIVVQNGRDLDEPSKDSGQ